MRFQQCIQWTKQKAALRSRRGSCVYTMPLPNDDLKLESYARYAQQPMLDLLWTDRSLDDLFAESKRPRSAALRFFVSRF